jgi:FkbM family methyltransferase
MNIFIDCGSNIGQGYDKLSKELSIDSTWEVYMFEPNKKCVDILKDKYQNAHILNKAVWIDNKTRKLNLEYCQVAEDWVGGSSNIIDSGEYVKPHYIHDEHLIVSESVECIDFSEFLLNFPHWHQIILKMDIEGAEFCVLDKMMQDLTIFLIDSIYIEWHERLLKQNVSRKKYIDFFKEYNIAYHDWD